MKEVSFGEKLQELLNWNGMSRSKLARMVGIAPSTVNSYVNGSRPSAEIADKIAAALGVSVTTLLNSEPLALTALEVTESEGVLLAKVRNLSPAQRELIEGIVDLVTEQNIKNLPFAVQDKNDKPE